MKQLPCIKQHVLGFEHFTSKLRPQPLNIALTQNIKLRNLKIFWILLIILDQSQSRIKMIMKSSPELIGALPGKELSTKAAAAPHQQTLLYICTQSILNSSKR